MNARSMAARKTAEGLDNMRVVIALAIGVIAAGCHAARPVRYVIDEDIGDLGYRRYQKVLDVEFPIQGIPAVGHIATYLRLSADGTVSVATAFVTVYAREAGLAKQIAAQLRSLRAYKLEIKKFRRSYVWALDDGEHEWLLWVSRNCLIKLGAARGVPESLRKAYLNRYPSDLDRRGR